MKFAMPNRWENFALNEQKKESKSIEIKKPKKKADKATSIVIKVALSNSSPQPVSPNDNNSILFRRQ